ncbi:MAG: hypothetical protein JRH10_03715 [Deltaproteobacteria bacterium]|nr:hypothetical protein [Deltaproteobacteria bacterium]MBW2444664.1 hypothetical protein [Deltaproteobacteria bacterium]
MIRFRTTCQGLALALVLTIATAATPAQAANDAAIGASSGVCSLLYAPAKLAFAGLGSVVSGLAYLMTGFDSDVARPIFYAAVRGDYVITPAHLEGRRVVEFVGRDPRDDPPPTPEVW